MSFHDAFVNLEILCTLRCTGTGPRHGLAVALGRGLLLGTVFGTTDGMTIPAGVVVIEVVCTRLRT